MISMTQEPLPPGRGSDFVLTAPDAGFAAFWAAYQRRTHRKAAWDAWKRLQPSQAVQRQILEALGIQSASKQWAEGLNFIPHPASWLRGRRWEDDPKAYPPVHADRCPKCSQSFRVHLAYPKGDGSRCP